VDGGESARLLVIVDHAQPAAAPAVRPALARRRCQIGPWRRRKLTRVGEQPPVRARRGSGVGVGVAERQPERHGEGDVLVQPAVHAVKGATQAVNGCEENAL